MTTMLQQAMEKVKNGDGEVLLDFAALPRIDVAVVGALQELAALAGERSATIVLRAVTADVYRVLKQLKLAERFSFLNC